MHAISKEVTHSASKQHVSDTKISTLKWSHVAVKLSYKQNISCNYRNRFKATLSTDVPDGFISKIKFQIPYLTNQLNQFMQQ